MFPEWYIIFREAGWSVADIEEICADTFITLWNNADKPEENRLKGYLLCIAKNKARDRLRKIKPDEETDIEDTEIVWRDHC